MSICKLTLKKGKYVKSHIIPKSLTRPSIPGSFFYHYDPKFKCHIKRPDSWYDKYIVIREGEDYLSDLDSYGIKELRDFGLVWSSNTIRSTASAGDYDLIIVDFKDPNKMRRFFLSLLWRAAVSSLPEFNEIELPPSDIERIRKIILGEEKDDLRFYPINLLQLPSKGPIHIFTPIKQRFGDNGDEIFRFYMDGLIIHFHIFKINLVLRSPQWPYEHPICVGYKQTIICQVETEVSFQLDNLIKLVKSGPRIK